MQISQKSKDIIDSCRFCWMCRHICPIGNVTGQERNTARARALSLSLVERGAAELKDDIVDNVYECSLCGACTNDCATGFDPVVFTKEVRTEAALNGNMPTYVDTLLNNIEKTGNVYGKTETDKKLSALIADKAKQKSDTLLFIGQDALCNAPETALNAMAVLDKAKIDYTVLKEEPTSGYDYDFLVGATDETKQAMQKCAEKINVYKKVICFDVADAKIFIREYKEYGVELNAEVVTLISVLAAAVSSGALKLKNSKQEYTFQDPALLARELEDLESGRTIIEACGINKEMLLNRKDTVLAGNSIMNLYMPQVMTLVAEKRMDYAQNIGATTLVTASPCEYTALKALNAPIAVKTIEQIILENTEA